MILILCFVGTIVGVLLIAWWSIRDNRRQLAEHAERIRQIYKEHE